MSRTRSSAKRALDIVTSGAAIVVTAPVIIATGLAVRKHLGSPVIFRQERPGQGGKVFEILKFRTMLEPDLSRNLVTNEQRMTPFGNFLRSTSLDELPSLINVLRGDMSLVGPRPLRAAYLERYSDEQSERHSLRPGLTGLAQTSGRNSLSWDDRLQLDVDYVRHWSLTKDLVIMIRTVTKVLKREGIRSEGQATMSEFFGPQSTADLSVRPLERGDLPLRVEWLRSPSIREGVSITFWPDLDSTEQWFDRVLKDPGRLDFVAYDRSSGSVQGMMGLVGIHDGVADLYIYVNPQSHGQGFGRQMMQLLMTKAREGGVTRLQLETKKSNTASLKLYRRLGFQAGIEPIGDAKIYMYRNL
ncbi:GNAT family N-acetyltransferase [Citricoccus nitrophenolicus]|uniref:GNAT family N-acetyltransferase n=1 Tax=Citricoccus nitrophenolicus TaxID=863575 RepID=A0ABV0II00_9MICC